MINHDTPSTDHYLPEIILSSHCQKHNAIKGVPCWFVPSDSPFVGFSAICNKRALHSGFNAKIDPRSLRRATGRKRG